MSVCVCMGTLESILLEVFVLGLRTLRNQLCTEKTQDIYVVWQLPMSTERFHYRISQREITELTLTFYRFTHTLSDSLLLCLCCVSFLSHHLNLYTNEREQSRGRRVIGRAATCHLLSYFLTWSQPPTTTPCGLEPTGYT